MTDADARSSGTESQAPCGVRSLRLPPEHASARHARAFLRAVLTGAGRAELVDAAELACTELVTNAVLHAHTDVVITVEVGHGARVAVRDFNPSPPRQRHYGVQATTGRGLALVTAVSDAHGVDDLGADGKTVWFTLGDPEARPSDDGAPSSWDTAEPAVDAAPVQDALPPTHRTVRLLQVPPTLWLAARQHEDALLRELAFYRSRHDVPADVAAADRVRSALSDAVVAVIEAAQRRGAVRPALPSGHPSPLPAVPAAFDIDIAVDAGIASDAAALQDVLDAAEELAATGALLSRPGLPEVVAVRDWACEQVQAQLAGVDPAPWFGTGDAQFVHAVDRQGSRQLQDFAASVFESDRPVVAADDANRIVAISRPLAHALGWEVDDLVGRRVVALIPPALREAHVAGFTRHLTTGQAHVLGVPLVLPVLRHDGTQEDCTFLIEQLHPVPGRSLYVATIEPVRSAPATDGVVQVR